MYNLLIVDDDKIIREDIKVLIEGQKGEFQIAGEANNGKEALQIIDAMPIDIVITDMYMPILNGIELIRKVKATHPDIKFLVISNYDDFSYVKEAMKLGAQDYLLKYEIEQTNLLTQLEILKNEIKNEARQKNEIRQKSQLNDKAQAYLIEQFWRNVLNGSFSKGDREAQAAKLDIKMKESNFVICQIDLWGGDGEPGAEANPGNDIPVSEFPIDTEQVFQDLKTKYLISVTKNRWIMILGFTEKSVAFLRNLSLAIGGRLLEALQSGNRRAVVTIGDLGISIGELHAGYIRLQKAAKDKFYRGTNIIIELMGFKEFASPMADGLPEDYRRRILQFIGAHDRENAVHSLTELAREIRQKRYEPDWVANFYVNLSLEIGKFAKDTGNVNGDIRYGPLDALQRIGKLVTLTDIHEYLAQSVHDICQSALNSQRFSRVETVKAVEFINKSYMNDLSLRVVAEHVGLSKNYFCRLFREDTGENFIDYLNRFRIEKAKFLFETTHCKTVEAAQRVGIQDYRYFCKVFKQITGQKPHEFKKAIRQIEDR